MSIQWICMGFYGVLMGFKNDERHNRRKLVQNHYRVKKKHNGKSGKKNMKCTMYIEVDSWENHGRLAL